MVETRREDNSNLERKIGEKPFFFLTLLNCELLPRKKGGLVIFVVANISNGRIRQSYGPRSNTCKRVSLGIFRRQTGSSTVQDLTRRARGSLQLRRTVAFLAPRTHRRAFIPHAFEKALFSSTDAAFFLLRTAIVHLRQAFFPLIHKAIISIGAQGQRLRMRCYFAFSLRAFSNPSKKQIDGGCLSSSPVIRRPRGRKNLSRTIVGSRAPQASLSPSTR